MTPPSPNSFDLPPGTVLETDEDIRRVQAEIRERAESANHRATAHEQDAGKTQASEEQPYRPLTRPPAALLIVCDDGKTTGDVIRLRHDRFIIGRHEGDLQLPEDEQISKRHVALTRQLVSGEFRWVVTDLQSRNGMFVRVNKAPLSNQAEVLIGSGRYRFEIIQTEAAEAQTFRNLQLASAAPNTRLPQNQFPPGTELLSEMVGGGIGTRMVLSRPEYWIGRDPSCEICRAHDPMTKARHARLSRSQRGTWVIQNHQTLNGVWLRLPQVSILRGCGGEFQIGEQRFRLEFGKS
jgi:pSer/pThr/pTyr-binding forkhead associated (FHA) protein